jgi:hypothetical protein
MSEGFKTGWMLFSAEDPIVGLSPQPAYAPVEPCDSAEGWFEEYSCFETRAEAEAYAEEDAEAYAEAVAAGDLEGSRLADIAYKVVVYDTGNVHIYDSDDALQPFDIYTPHDIFVRGFGFSDVPEANDKPRSDEADEPKLDFTKALVDMPVYKLIQLADLALNRLTLRDLGEIGHEAGFEFKMELRDPPSAPGEPDMLKDFANTIEKALKDNAISDEWAWVFEDMAKSLKGEE